MENNTENQKLLVSKLRQEYRIIYLLYHRNKNQHKSTIWWKQFNILKRNISKLLEVLDDVVYRKKHHESNYVKIHSLMTGFLKTKLKKVYYDFNGVIALGQFVVLGVVLVGILARVYSLYKDLYEALEKDFIRVGCQKSDYTNVVDAKMNDGLMNAQFNTFADEELGEEITDDSVANLLSGSRESLRKIPRRSAKKKDKRKDKRKKSVIDDIFG